MRPNWKETPRPAGGVVRWQALYVTLNPKGEIRLSRTTYEKFGAPAAVQILFDDLNNRIGLKPTSPSFRNSFPMARNGSHGARRIYARSLLYEWHLDIPQTIRFYDAKIDEDGILVLDLRTARVPNQVHNHPRNRRRRSQDGSTDEGRATE